MKTLNSGNVTRVRPAIGRPEIDWCDTCAHLHGEGRCIRRGEPGDAAVQAWSYEFLATNGEYLGLLSFCDRSCPAWEGKQDDNQQT